MIRSQLDPNVYSGFRRNGNTIGDLLNMVKLGTSVYSGVRGVQDDIQTRRKKKQDASDSEYLNTVFGKHLQGWDGSQDDFMTRSQAAIGEVVSTRPELYSSVVDEINQGFKRQQEAQAQGLDTKEQLLDIDKKTEEIKKSQLNRKVKELELGLKQNEIIGQYMADAKDPQSYKSGILHLKRLGISTALPDTFEEFAQNPNQYYDWIAADKQRREKQIADIESSMKKSQLTEQQYETKMKEIELEYLPREKELGLREKAADIEKPKSQNDLKIWMRAKSDIDRKHKPINSMISTANMVISALESGNPAAIEPIKTKIMRMYGEVGTMTDKDINRAGGNPAVKSKIQRWISKGMKGLPPQQDINDFIALVNIAKNKKVDEMNTMLSQQENIYKSQGIDVSDITSEYKIGEGGGMTPSSKKPKFTIESVE